MSHKIFTSDSSKMVSRKGSLGKMNVQKRLLQECLGICYGTGLGAFTGKVHQTQFCDFVSSLYVSYF